eukprot:RCo044761
MTTPEKQRYDAINCIVEGKMYLGNRYAAAALGFLQGLGVTHVVNAAEEQPNFFPDHLVYYNCNLKDNLTEKIDFDGPLRFIQQAFAQGGVVFVHCLAGVSRSTSIVAAYVMKNYGMSLRDTLAKIAELRPCINPNPNFVRQLMQLEAKLAAAQEGSKGSAPSSSASQLRKQPGWDFALLLKDKDGAEPDPLEVYC